MTDQPTKVVVRSGRGEGIRLLIHPRTEKFYWTGLHETWVQESIAASLMPGMVFWDAGAHVGFMTLIGSRLVGPFGAVVAFEPSPENRERLIRNVGLNNAANVRVEDCALDASSGTALLYSHEASLMRTLDPGRGRGVGEPVICRTLDEVALGLPLPDLIKIDVEGRELEVLRGGSELLRRHEPRLLIEFSNEELVREAMEFLPQYTFTYIEKNHWFLT
ncbi:MAG: FkbM family methyltransferase [Dehalococcoidia bacterium]|nr:FkbM family methyltransferase [Dehalococcoidia bacterium]